MSTTVKFRYIELQLGDEHESVVLFENLYQMYRHRIDSAIEEEYGNPPMLSYVFTEEEIMEHSDFIVAFESEKLKKIVGEIASPLYYSVSNASKYFKIVRSHNRGGNIDEFL